MPVSESAGSRWYKNDFQVASPLGGFSRSGADLETGPGCMRAGEEYVNVIAETRIEVFSVTDHNSTKLLETIRCREVVSGSARVLKR